MHHDVLKVNDRSTTYKLLLDQAAIGYKGFHYGRPTVQTVFFLFC